MNKVEVQRDGVPLGKSELYSPVVCLMNSYTIWRQHFIRVVVTLLDPWGCVFNAAEPVYISCTLQYSIK
jgi:hypothetical protein